MRKAEVKRILHQLVDVLKETETCFFVDALIVEYHGRRYLLYAVRIREDFDKSRWSELAVAVEKALGKGEGTWSCCPQ